jgi:hypothetical protein
MQVEISTSAIIRCIGKAIHEIASIRAMIEAVMRRIGEENDYHIILDIRKKTRKSEQKLNKYVNKLISYHIKPVPISRLERVTLKDKITEMHKFSSAINFNKEFTRNLILFGFPAKTRVKSDIPVKGFLEIMQTKMKDNLLLGVLDLKCLNKKFKQEVSVFFLFGIKITIFLSKGVISKYAIFGELSSLNIKQLLELFINFCSIQFQFLQMDAISCILIASDWIHSHRHIFTSKCPTCGNHLSFESGIPMLPLFLHCNEFFHISCSNNTSFL